MINNFSTTKFTYVNNVNVQKPIKHTIIDSTLRYISIDEITSMKPDRRKNAIRINLLHSVMK